MLVVFALGLFEFKWSNARQKREQKLSKTDSSLDSSFYIAFLRACAQFKQFLKIVHSKKKQIHRTGVSVSNAIIKRHWPSPLFLLTSNNFCGTFASINPCFALLRHTTIFMWQHFKTEITFLKIFLFPKKHIFQNGSQNGSHYLYLSSNFIIMFA